VRRRWQQISRRLFHLHCAHPLGTSRSLRPIPITGPASILAAILVLVLITLAAQQTGLAATLGPRQTPRFWVAARLASITNSGASSSWARRLCSIGFPILKTPST